MLVDNYGEMAKNPAFADISDKIIYPESGILQLVLPPFGMVFFNTVGELG